MSRAYLVRFRILNSDQGIFVFLKMIDVSTRIKIAVIEFIGR